MAYAVERKNRYTGYYRDKSGVRHSAGTYDSKDEAVARAKSAEMNGDVGEYRATMTLDEFVRAWLPDADLMPLTKKSYQSVLHNHVLPILGTCKVGDITRAQVRRMNQLLAKGGVSRSMRSHAGSALGSAMKELVGYDIIEVNPTHSTRVSAPEPKTQNGKVLEPTEYKLIRQHLPHPTAQLFSDFLITSGCRFGEATEVRVNDVDLDTGEVYLERRVVDLGGEHNNGERFLVIPGTKSGRTRTVVVSKALREELAKHIQERSLTSDSLLFSKSLVAPVVERKLEEKPVQSLYGHGTRTAYTKVGCRCQACRDANAQYRRQQRAMRSKSEGMTVLNISDHLPRDTWRRIWNRAIKEAGISWTPRTHDLRHANATMLLKNGIDLHEVKERLGHSSIQTTEKYLHRVQRMKSKAAEAVSEFL
jgi:integrase